MDLTTLLNMATTAAVVGGVAFGGWQLKLAARTRTTQISLSMLQSLYSRDLSEGFTALMALPDELPLRELETRLGENWSAAFRAFTAMDGIGLLVFRNEVPLDVADDFFHHSVTVVWQKMHRAMDDLRVEMKDDTVGEFLQWLAQAIAARRLNHPREPAYRNRSPRAGLSKT